MARNLKPEYINKLRKMEVPNGYKFDIANYLYNPDISNDYPSFHKVIKETETTETYRRVYYMKHYDGTGEYMEEIFDRQKEGAKWQIVQNRIERTLCADTGRFSVKKLLTFCAE